MKRLLIAFAFALITSAAIAGSDSGDGYKCATVKSSDGVAEVREGPGTQHASTFQVRNGQSVYIERRQGSWVFINATVQNRKTYTDIEGWIYAPLLKNIECAC
jgi:uncharacterized protein YgiM (DUF1202 family)